MRKLQIGELQAAEQSLEKLGQMYRSGHIERQKLVAQWTESVNQLQNRDKQIEDIAQVRFLCYRILEQCT